jgi:hypothetical protein
MRRALFAGLVCTSVLAPAVAQSFQFMGAIARTRESLLMPVPRNWRGYATGGDLDGDGRSDLVATHDFGASVLLRSATGWTVLQDCASPGQRPVLADLDGDGDLDLACVPPHVTAQHQLQLYSNAQGLMTPVALPPIMVGLTLRGVAVGRVDGDAFADLVVATVPAPGVPSLVLVRGAGLQFTIDLAALPALPQGLWPELLDLDGDGDLDVLATSPGSGLHLLRNDAGTFVDATSTLPATPLGPEFLVAGDLDGDGRGDCAATLATGHVDVLWGSPTLPAWTRAATSLTGLRTLAPADFDGDGDLDLLVEHGQGLDVLWNQGNRQFARAGVTAEPTSMRGVGDVDGDGAADVVFAATADEQLARCKYRAQHEDAAFAAGIGPLTEGGHSISAAGDVDGDGRTDLVSVEWSRVTVDHAQGAHGYRRTVSPLAVAAAGGLWRTELADLDGDQDLDLVVKDDARLSIARNDGTGTFAWAMQHPAPSTGRDDLRVGDIDGDGDLDLVHATTSGGVQVVRNLGGGQYASAAVAGYITAPRSVELADMDRDGDLDLITDVPLGLQCVAANNGQGVFAMSTAFSLVLPGIPTITLRAADFDADGDADVFVGGLLGLRVFRNNGSGAFTETTAADLPQISFLLLNSNVVVADLDQDGDDDAAMMRFTAGIDSDWLLLFNDGTGRFVDRSAQRGLPPGLGSSGSLRAADLDDDGDLDFVAGTRFHQVFSYNFLRQCRSASLPRLGGIATLDLFSGPVFGQPGLGLLAFAPALAAAPVRVPGLAGQLELDGASLQIAAAVATSSIGVSTVFVGVPQDGALFGLEVWFQGAVLPGAIEPPGFTNAVREVVLR